MSRYQARLDPARCEWCGGIVSESAEKGDTSNPIRAGAHSPGAQFWHTQCADAFERAYISPRFWEPTVEAARERLEREGGAS